MGNPRRRSGRDGPYHKTEPEGGSGTAQIGERAARALRRPMARAGCASSVYSALHSASHSRLPDALVPWLYAIIAPVHDGLARRVAADARDVALRWLAVADGTCVVELAPGTGLAFQRIVNANPSGFTLGLDRSAAMLKRARCRMARRSAGWRLRVGDARRVPVPSATVDAVYAGYLFDQWRPPIRRDVLREVCRILRPGGRLVLQHMTLPQSAAARGWACVARTAPLLLGRCQPIALVPDLRATGFTRLRRRYIEQNGFPSEVVYAERVRAGHTAAPSPA